VEETHDIADAALLVTMHLERAHRVPTLRTIGHASTVTAPADTPRCPRALEVAALYDAARSSRRQGANTGRRLAVKQRLGACRVRLSHCGGVPGPLSNYLVLRRRSLRQLGACATEAADLALFVRALADWAGAASIHIVPPTSGDAVTLWHAGRQRLLLHRDNWRQFASILVCKEAPPPPIRRRHAHASLEESQTESELEDIRSDDETATAVLSGADIETEPESEEDTVESSQGHHSDPAEVWSESQAETATATSETDTESEAGTAIEEDVDDGPELAHACTAWSETRTQVDTETEMEVVEEVSLQEPEDDVLGGGWDSPVWSQTSHETDTGMEM